jgi:cytochrome c oxidase subunit 1
MHFLGMNGMPRRIPDYPDSYQNLNTLCSLGSLISISSLVVFLIIVKNLLNNKNSN